MRTTITIQLEIEGDPGDAHDIVNSVLDAGELQDAINDYDTNDGAQVLVTSAVVLS